MSSSPRYLERDLFELGATAQYLVQRAHEFWLWADPADKDREVPPVLSGLVDELTAGLQHLAQDARLESTRQLMQEAETSLLAAWKAYNARWMGGEHRQQCFGAADEDCMPSPEDWERLSPLATNEWREYRRSLGAMLTELPQDLSLWPKLGSLIVQVLGLDADTREQAQILGEVFPIPKLQDVLRTVRDAYPVLSDVDVELSDPRTHVPGYKDVDRVQRQVKLLYEAIVDRLVTISPTSPQPTDETAQPAARATEPGSPSLPDKPECASAQVALYGPGTKPIVNGKSKPVLTPAQYAVVIALIEAGPDGLTKDRFDRKSGHGDSRKIMKRLADSDPDWRAVLLLAGKTGGRYRIR